MISSELNRTNGVMAGRVIGGRVALALLLALVAAPVGAATLPHPAAPAALAVTPNAPKPAQKAVAAALPKPAAAAVKKPVLAAAQKPATVVAGKPAAVVTAKPASVAVLQKPAVNPLVVHAVMRKLAGPRPQAIPIEAENGAYIVPVVVNGVLPLKFIVDSGSADVSIPADVAFQLKQMGTMTGTDFLGKKTYQLADGSQISSEIYKVASLKLGSLIMHDVTVRISAEKSSLLLGQSFLNRLTSWSMDNAKKVLIITGGA